MVVTSISIVFTLGAAILSIAGIAITGFYPAIIVLWILALLSMGSRYYAKKIITRSNNFQRKYFRTFTIFNLLLILVVLWMIFVIVHDRVLHDCC